MERLSKIDIKLNAAEALVIAQRILRHYEIFLKGVSMELNDAILTKQELTQVILKSTFSDDSAHAGMIGLHSRLEKNKKITAYDNNFDKLNKIGKYREPIKNE